MAWRLLVESFHILRRDKRLVVFPILSALGVIAITVPYFAALTGDAPWHSGTGLRVSGPPLYGWLFLWYCAISFAMIFCNCALAACVQIRFSGGEPSIASGFEMAARRAWDIFLWAVAASTVGILIRYIEDRLNWIGKIIAATLGFGWSLATYLIVPVLVLEDRDALESIRRSSELLKRTWGEQLIVQVHFFWIGLLLSIPGVVAGVLFMPLGVLYFLTLVAVMSATRQIFVVALYRFAVSGEAPDGFSNDSLGSVFRSR